MNKIEGKSSILGRKKDKGRQIAKFDLIFDGKFVFIFLS